MASTFLEQTRGACRHTLLLLLLLPPAQHCCLVLSMSTGMPTAALHEDLERLERVIVKDYRALEARTHREKLSQSHRVRRRMDEMQAVARKLVCPMRRIYRLHTAKRRYQELLAMAVDSCAV
jgi:hypothetical protein